jgi:carbon storage regulator CsrA
MLVVSRKCGTGPLNKVVIGDNIILTVLKVSISGRVRLGIEAPPEVRVDRNEVFLARLAEAENGG